MTYQEVLGYLNSFLNYEQAILYRYPEAFSLDRVEQLLQQLKYPHRAYPSIHVAGTKGKGSTCAFLASIFRASGYRTALYTSPHLFDFRERLQIDGIPISESEMVEVVEQIKPFADKKLTFFEITTVCAFLWFAQRRVNAAVIEVGLGGRLDATNVLEPRVTILTPVGLDHLSQLGSTLGKIAWEKAGILKPETPAVIAPQPPAAREVILQRASQIRAPWHEVEREVQMQGVQLSKQATQVSLQTPEALYREITLPLLGRHQLVNAAAAVRAAELFQLRQGLPLSEEAVRQGLLQTKWPGRCQFIPGEPAFLLDGAQTRESAQALRRTVEELFPRQPVCLIVGVSTDKDLAGLAEIWGPWADRIFLTKANVSRAEPLERLEKAFVNSSSAIVKTASVQEALQQAHQTAAPEELLVVGGSLFVVAEALRFIEELYAGVAGGPGRERPPGSPRGKE